MSWRTVIVNQHSKLSYQNNHLVFKSAQQTELIHLSEIDILLLETTDIVITTMLIKKLVDEKVLVIFCDDKRLPHAQLQAFYARHDSSLQLNKQLQWQDDIKCRVWTDIIAQKIINQTICLEYFDLYEKITALNKLLDELQPFDSTNREGHVARIYFNQLFGNDFNRDQNNDINAALDYGYSLILSMFAREITLNGCMTQFGLKHSNQFNHFNLASDLMEPFRPLIDKIVYENRCENFTFIKKKLFTIFVDTFEFNHREMYLTNIISEYTKKVIKCLNNDKNKGVPVFRL